MAIQQRNIDGTIKSDYGDTSEKRYCPSCDSFFPLDNFHKDARGTLGLTRRCKQCHSGKSYQSRIKRPNLRSERYESMRKWMLDSKYNLTVEDFERLLKQQRGLCKICGTKPEKWWSNEANGGLSIDHHHACGKVRGLLCSNCNTAIGLLGENDKNLKRAIKYLKMSVCCEGAPAD